MDEDGEELDENGRPYIKKASFAKMRKLDSFIKESQRMNPHSLCKWLPLHCTGRPALTMT